ERAAREGLDDLLQALLAGLEARPQDLVARGERVERLLKALQVEVSGDLEGGRHVVSRARGLHLLERVDALLLRGRGVGGARGGRPDWGGGAGIALPGEGAEEVGLAELYGLAQLVGELLARVGAEEGAVAGGEAYAAFGKA